MVLGGFFGRGIRGFTFLGFGIFEGIALCEGYPWNQSGKAPHHVRATL